MGFSPYVAGPAAGAGDGARGLPGEAPFIFVTGSPGEEMAPKALKSGAADFIPKHRIAALPAALREAQLHLQRKRAEQEIRRLNQGRNIA